MTRTLEEFMSDMEPFYGLFDTKTNLENYYGAMAGRMPSIARIYIREAIRSIGYDVIGASVHHSEVEQLLDCFGTEHRNLVDLNWYFRLIPSDFVIHFEDRFLNSQLAGNFLASDLLSVSDSGELTIEYRGTIFRDILLGYVMYGERNAIGENMCFDKMNSLFLKLRTADDITSLYKAYLLHEFISAAGRNVPDGVRAFHASHDVSAIESKLKAYMLFFKFIVVEQSVISEHVLGNLRDLSHISWVFNRITTGSLSTGTAANNLLNFVTKFRLDTDFPAPVSRYTVNPALQ
jgi:hypothetical protein